MRTLGSIGAIKCPVTAQEPYQQKCCDTLVAVHERMVLHATTCEGLRITFAIPIRIVIAGRPTLAEFFGALSERYTQGLEHQDVCIDSIGKTTAIRKVKGDPCSIREFNDVYSVYDLSFWAIDREGELQYALDLRQDAFDSPRPEPFQRAMEKIID